LKKERSIICLFTNSNLVVERIILSVPAIDIFTCSNDELF